MYENVFAVRPFDVRLYKSIIYHINKNRVRKPMSKLISISDNRFHLHNQNISYLFQVSPEGILEHLYFGQRVDGEGLAAGPRRAFRCTTLEFEGVKNYNLSDTPQEYPLFGRSDMRRPALHLINAEGNTTNNLLYNSHRILDNKPQLDGLPSARGGDSCTLVVVLVDEQSQLRVELSFTVYEHHNVIARSASIHNDGAEMQQVEAAMSSVLDLPAADYEMLHFTGTWSREFNIRRTPVAPGRFEISSASGTSSNVHSPFMAIMEKQAGEQHGQVWSTALVYSGNFSIGVEKGEFESVRLTAGINPFNFNWKLGAGESFTTPESLQVYSTQGLDAMSQTWHAFIRDKISPPQFVNQARPTYLNSWEAAYFDVNDELVDALADRAKSLGLEMLVVDDGWFRGRDDDTSSLGDWFSDDAKFPNGIEAAAARVRDRGLKFGLWFEPEMVNEDSDLYRAHPDWVIHTPGRKLSTGRQQLTLDLSREEVVEYLFERIDSFLSSGQIDYVKWDMNRVMTEIGSAGLPAEKQLETAHRYMLGVYSLVSRITAKHPKVLFENCASGGNRFDLGMLHYMAQGWVSDMSEPIGRLAIVTGASYLYPQNVLAAYIGPVPSHLNDRLASLDLRADVSFFCAARGLSLNEEDIAADEDGLKSAIEKYKRSSSEVVNARFHRLINNDNEVCWQLVSEDGSKVYLGYFHILSAPNLPYRRVRLNGLDSAATYHDPASEKNYRGDALMRMGLDLPYVHAIQWAENENYMPKGDYSSWVLELERVI